MKNKCKDVEWKEICEFIAKMTAIATNQIVDNQDISPLTTEELMKYSSAKWGNEVHVYLWFWKAAREALESEDEKVLAEVNDILTRMKTARDLCPDRYYGIPHIIMKKWKEDAET